MLHDTFVKVFWFRVFLLFSLAVETFHSHNIFICDSIFKFGENVFPAMRIAFIIIVTTVWQSEENVHCIPQFGQNQNLKR